MDKWSEQKPIKFTPTMNVQDYRQGQEVVDQNIEVIRVQFEQLLVEVNAGGGFFGYVDLVGFIRIAVCKGKYFHLHSGSGFTGKVFQQQHAAICEIGALPFEQTVQEVEAEMAAPIFFKDSVFGVLLVDRYTSKQFSKRDLSVLTKYAHLIEKKMDLLSDTKPWREFEKNTQASSFELLEDGYVCLQRRAYADAVKLFQRVLRNEPENASARYHLSESLLGLGEIKAAYNECAKVIDLEPNYVGAKGLLELVYTKI